jgi:glycosyltransferase involved in cell wall biosynthesis
MEPLNRVMRQSPISGGFSNTYAKGKVPLQLPSPLYLNLGCGKDVRDGFLNIDLYSDDERVIAMDIRFLELPDNCADGILASDVLEHFSHRETDDIIAEWARVLKPGGELVIRCPSLRLQCKAYMDKVWDADIASYMIFGGQTNPGDYHCIGFDEDSIRKHLINAGLEVVHFEEVDTPQNRGYINLNMTVHCRKNIMTTKALHDTPTPAEQNITTKKINIVWEGSQFVYHSLALINRQICSELLKTPSVELTIIPYENDTFSPENDSQLQILQQHDIRYKKESDSTVKKLPYLWIRHTWPPKKEIPQGAKWIIMQPWEFTTHRKDFVEIFQQVDEIWTPSLWSRQSFIHSGIPADKVQIIPNGIDPKLHTPFGSKKEYKAKEFKFLFVGGTIFRKGIDILLQAYIKTFSAADNVSLIIKDMGGDSFYKGQTAKEIIEEIQQKANNPHIIYVDSMYSDEEMAELYRSCDVFISPYRGEGFCLPALEAMANGLPVIVTKGGATDDFVDDTVGLLIDSTPLAIGNSIANQELTDTAFLLEPSLEDTADCMKFAFSHPEVMRHLGISAAMRARTQWTWRTATLKALSRIDYLYQTTLSKEYEDRNPVFEDGIIAFGHAELAFQSNQVDDAVALYQASFTIGGLPLDYALLALHRLALLSLLDDDITLCEEFLQKAGTLFHKHPDTIFIQSRIHSHREQWVEALETVQYLLDNWSSLRFQSYLGIDLSDILTETARSLFSLGDVEAAHTLYSSALELRPENADACFGAGLCLLDAGASDEAKIMFDWAIRLSPAYSTIVQEMFQ